MTVQVPAERLAAVRRSLEAEPLPRSLAVELPTTRHADRYRESEGSIARLSFRLAPVRRAEPLHISIFLPFAALSFVSGGALLMAAIDTSSGGLACVGLAVSGVGGLFTTYVVTALRGLTLEALRPTSLDVEGDRLVVGSRVVAGVRSLRVVHRWGEAVLEVGGARGPVRARGLAPEEAEALRAVLGTALGLDVARR